MRQGSAHGLRALPDWSAVPSNSEEDRVLLNGRIAYFGAAVGLLSLGFVVFNVVLALFVMPRAADYFLATGAQLHFVATSVFGCQWLLCRKRRRTSLELNLIDVGGLTLAMVVFAAMALSDGSDYSQAANLTLISVTIIITHAIIVPSTRRRAVGVSALASLPAPCATWMIAQRAVPAELLAQMPWIPVSTTVYVGLWSLLAVVVSGLAVQIIYGLQQKVKEATELGQYTLEEQIGEGGMGIVYKARHALLRRPTAIKLLPREQAGELNVRRFEREVQLTSGLTHPHTIAIFDFGHTPEGVFYYAMEYLDGVTLEDLVTFDGPQPVARVLHVLHQAASALVEAHSVGLIHRDIKPANLMLCVRGKIPDYLKVLDFGLVKERSSRDQPELSAVETIVGTPLYLAPEAIRGAEVDERIDLYALGAVGYHLLVGHPVFEAQSVVEVLAKHLHEQPIPLSQRVPNVPPAVEDLLLACLSKSPDQRPRSAQHLVDALEQLCRAHPWSTAQANTWWDERSVAVLGKIREQHATGRGRSGPRTVAVDLERRAG